MSNLKHSKIYFLKRELNNKGGLEKAAKAIISLFSKRGWETHLLTCGAGIPSDYCLHQMKRKKGLSFQKVLSFDKNCQSFLSKRKDSIIFGLDRNSFQTHLRAGNGCHLSYLLSRKKTDTRFKTFSFSLNPLHRLILSIEKKSFENQELRTLFTNSHMVKNQILSHYNLDEKKIIVVHNGVEWQELQTPFNRSLEKRPFETLHLNPDAIQLLFIGNNYFRKGLLPLLKGLSHFKKTPFELSVLGKEKNISYFKKVSCDLGLEKKVTFFNSQDPLPFYQCADIVTIPSYYDPFSNVTLEALAMGNFVLTSQSNGGNEVLTNQNGTIIKDLDCSEEWIEKLGIAFNHFKTKDSAIQIRQSVKYLEFSNQIDKIIAKTAE